MAHEFLSRGHDVVICGRNYERLKAAHLSLQQRNPSACDRIHYTKCDVSNARDVYWLSDLAQEKLGTVHRWINNAGEVTSKRLLADLAHKEIERVVGSNVLGSLYGCRAAIKVMREQPQFAPPRYHIFNMGFSSWGASFSKSACTHKMTKTALTQLSISLSEELKAAGCTSIGVHNLSPGMVLTDLLLKGASPVAKRFFNALAEEPETVAAALVPRIIAVQVSWTMHPRRLCHVLMIHHHSLHTPHMAFDKSTLTLHVLAHGFC